MAWIRTRLRNGKTCLYVLAVIGGRRVTVKGGPTPEIAEVVRLRLELQEAIDRANRKISKLVPQRKIGMVERASGVAPKSPGRIYMIQAVDGGPIKIGFTTGHVSRRLAEVQTCSASKLVIRRFFGGSRADEKRLHKRFADARMNGEWFRPVDGLTAMFSKKRMKLGGQAGDPRSESGVLIFPSGTAQNTETT